MSLYDDASLVFIPAGAAGRGLDQFGRIYNIKPELDLYSAELVTNEDLSESGTVSTTSWSLGWALSGGSQGETTIANRQLTLTNEGSEARADAYMTNGTSAFFDLDDGESYYVTYTVVDNSDGDASDLLIYAGSSNSFDAGTNIGKHSVIVTQSGADSPLIFQLKSLTSSITLSNISVKKIKNKSVDWTITRGTDLGATFINKDGLIDKSYENLLLGTEDLNNSTYWFVHADPLYTNPLPEGEVVGYNGRKDGVFTIDKTSGHNNYIMSKKPGNTVTTADDEVWTYSIYAKAANEESELLVGIWDSNDDNDPNWSQTAHAHKVFSLTGESVSGNATSNDTNSKSAPRYYMEKIGDDGWYRCSITNVSQIEDRQVRFQPRESYSIDGNTHESPGKVYVMHPQFEKGSKPSPYVKTGSETVTGGLKVDEPRFDYEGGGCPGLLIERAKTNLIEQSEWLKSWAFAGEADSTYVITPNYAISPDGGYNATYYNASDGWRYIRYNVTLIPETKYVFSFYCKNIDATRLIARVYNEDSDSDVVASHNYLSDVSTTEWTRIEVPFTTPATDENYAVYLNSGQTIVSGESSGGGVLWWGAQLEKQDHSGNTDGYASSYIPTNGATVTRDLDNITHIDDAYTDGITNNYNTTIFFDGKNIRRVGLTRYVTIQDDGANEDPRILLYSSNNNATDTHSLNLQYRKNGTSSTDVLIVGPTDLEFNDRFKAIARFNGPAMDLFVNGTKYSTAAIEPQRDLNRIDLSENSDGGHKIESLIVWPKTLTDQECKDLTTL